MIDHQEGEDLFTHPDAGQEASTATPPPSNDAGQAPGASIGERLRGAREARSLSLADCGRELRLPIKVLGKLEANDFGAAEHYVFMRGVLKGYAKFLGLPPGSCDEALRAVAPSEQPALVSVARTSQTRWLLQRYGTAATYIILTATIAVPLVLLGLRGGLQRPTPRVVSLDQPAVSTQAPPASATATHAIAPVPSPDATPFKASMTPFSAIGLNDQSQPETATDAMPAAASTVAAAAGQHTLTLAASGDCWFEITDADGNKIDSGMLHAGDSRSWHSAGELHVTLGNTGAVSATQDGKPISLAAFQRANVAHFDVFGSSGVSENN
ncbi:MAG: helix-turn-helix domain-containing protein [Rhodanobacteraceae bacterium]|nr:MAG: helix-turn-helix domain-containing protein [Rhodanobacteraceae bacterium]